MGTTYVSRTREKRLVAAARICVWCS